MKLSTSIIFYFVYYHSFLHLLKDMATGGGSLNALFESGPEFVLTHKFEEDKWTLPSIFSLGLSSQKRY